MNWQDFLTDEERETLERLDAERAAASALRRKIWDRCRKRMKADGA